MERLYLFEDESSDRMGCACLYKTGNQKLEGGDQLCNVYG